jgi:hypothetical protein
MFILFFGFVAFVVNLRNLALIWTSVMLNFLLFVYMSDYSSPLNNLFFGIIAVFFWPAINLLLIFSILNKKMRDWPILGKQKKKKNKRNC